MSSKTLNWMDKRIEEKLVSYDEKLFLRLYRFVKKHYEFFLGCTVTFIVLVFVFN